MRSRETYYVVYFRHANGPWSFADQQAVANSYESYPVMYMTRARAEAWAAEFRKVSGPGHETRVVPVTITPPKD